MPSSPLEDMLALQRANTARLVNEVITALTAGQAVTVTATGYAFLTVLAGAGATVTVSKVDSAGAVAHTSGAENVTTLAASTESVIVRSWPYYRVSVAGGPCRIALS